MAFCATFVLVLVIFSVMRKVLEQYEERYATKGTATLENMFFFVSTKQIVALTLAVASILFVLGLVISGIIGAIVFATVGFFTPFVGIRYLKKRRIAKFNRQLVDALAQMSAAFKAGLTLPQAAENIAQEIGPPLGQEFGLLVKEIKLGIPMEEALTNMAVRVGSDDLDLVVTSTNIARQLGGNMAEMFDIISATIRERFRLEGRINALTSQGRMQGWVVSLMPLVVGIVYYYMRPDLMKPMLAATFGKVVILVILLMETVGMFWIQRIVDIDV